VTNELPFPGVYFLIASFALALAQGDLDSAGGVITAVLALAVILGLAEIVRRALGAVELPRGHHSFDLYESIRSNAVNVAVERFIAACSS
jgi:hypothetical protein